MALPKGFKHSEETRRKILASLIGRKHSEETKKKISDKNKGKIFSVETREKLSISHKGLMSGAKHPNWKGGLTPLNQRIKNSPEYKLWREAVFIRDNYICVWCGITSGKGVKVVLNADHIKPFALFPELRFSIDNGRTLCVSCHKTTDTYAGRIRTYVCN